MDNLLTIYDHLLESEVVNSHVKCIELSISIRTFYRYISTIRMHLSNVNNYTRECVFDRELNTYKIKSLKLLD